MRGAMTKIFLLFVVLILWVSSAQAQDTYYVKKTGSDSNSCASVRNSGGSTSKLTINAGQNCMAAGDTVIVFAGTYNESIGDTFTPTAGTDASHKSVFKANPADAAVTGAGTVILKPSSGNRVVDFNGAVHAFLSIEGFVMDSSLLIFDTVKITSGAHDIDIIGCDISMGATPNPHVGMGILISNSPPISQNVLIKNCVIHGNGDSSAAQDHQIYVSHTNNVTIDGCTFYDSTSHGVQVWDGSEGSGCNDIVIKNCTAYNCDRGYGIYAGARNVIYNCIAYSNAYGIFFRNDGGTVDSPAAYNNTLISNSGYGININGVAIGAAVVKNNICYSNGVDIQNDDGATVLATNLTGTNPSFVDLSGHDYHLTSGSTAAIGQGTDLSGTFTTDKDGVTRSTWDIGAYFYAGGGSTPQSVTHGVVNVKGKVVVH